MHSRCFQVRWLYVVEIVGKIVPLFLRFQVGLKVLRYGIGQVLKAVRNSDFRNF